MLSAALTMPKELSPMSEENDTAERMADAIQDCMKQNYGRCRIRDVEAMGFTRDEVARYWPLAWQIIETTRPRPRQC